MLTPCSPPEADVSICINVYVCLISDALVHIYTAETTHSNWFYTYWQHNTLVRPDAAVNDV